MQDCASWFSMVQDGSRWFTMVHDGSRWFTMVFDKSKPKKKKSVEKCFLYISDIRVLALVI